MSVLGFSPGPCVCLASSVPLNYTTSPEVMIFKAYWAFTPFGLGVISSDLLFEVMVFKVAHSLFSSTFHVFTFVNCLVVLIMPF